MTDTRQTPQGVPEAAARLLEAAATRVPCAPVRDLIGTSDIGAAYAVQQRVTAARLARGARVVGHKIGLTSPAVQQQLGVDQPDFGVLLDDMGHTDGDTVPYASVLQPRIEAEIAFVLGADLAEGPLDPARVRAAVDHAVAALEICGSRVAGWDITLSDTVADNASAGAFVLGRERRGLDEFEPRTAVMEMSVDGRTVSKGTGADCLGDPLAALLWLARTARDLGDPLRAGHVVLSGALGPMSPLAPGAQVTAVIGGLGTVSTAIGEGTV
ncbi:putative hydratase/decarboxylase [Streptomyces viridiviolaceus]|uniref:2-keto-4-pentenoate hydratase n=1 Tax=Streptomyces viridiviolaceus TaxID=68282 RepID=A0ABW2E795_9ACTN|nr:fumarylacetoacetate hydrolase family protein [Streptomyces viridiviolaceus]GHB51889.1 putative hydratase/decarboxylase [Streptomyces viridiviolaceus]